MLRTGCFTVVVPLGGFTTFELRGFPRFVVGRGFAAAGVEDMMWGRGCRGRAELTESRLVEHLVTGEENNEVLLKLNSFRCKLGRILIFGLFFQITILRLSSWRISDPVFEQKTTDPDPAFPTGREIRSFSDKNPKPYVSMIEFQKRYIDKSNFVAQSFFSLNLIT